MIPIWEPNHKHVSRASSLVSSQVHVGEWKRQGTFVKGCSLCAEVFHQGWWDPPLWSKVKNAVGTVSFHLESPPLERESAHSLPKVGGLGNSFDMHKPWFVHLLIEINNNCNAYTIVCGPELLPSQSLS